MEEIKNSTKFITAVATAAFVGAAIYFLEYRKSRRRLTNIAEEGYETAHDILYPGKKKWRTNVRFGPVLPE